MSRVEEEIFEEWDRGGTLSEEEKNEVEDEVNKFFIEELKEENDKLKEMVEEMTMKAEEESKKRAKAETEVKREKEMVDNLMKILLKRSSEESGAQVEEALDSRNTIGRRGECRSLVVEEEVRTEFGHQQQEQGFLKPPAMVRGARYTMVGAQPSMLEVQQPPWGAQQPRWGGQQPLWGAQHHLWGAQHHLWGAQHHLRGAQQPREVAFQPLYGDQHGWRWVHRGWLGPQL